LTRAGRRESITLGVDAGVVLAAAFFSFFGFASKGRSIKGMAQ